AAHSSSGTMFAQDYGDDDEMSGDDGRRSPRGAAGFATRAVDNAERSGASERGFEGGRRRGQVAFGGDRFGVAKEGKNDWDGVEHDERRETVTELRDFSSKVWRPKGDPLPSGASAEDKSRDRAEAARREAEEK
ncbi:unnamed protein product, partial [Polarella glacialis]